jgi:FAD/FMN-containing dehydrogenase
MQPHAGGRVYVNFLGEEGGNRVRQAYGARNYERLVDLKRAYDPTNFFRLNQTSSPERREGLRPVRGRRP